MKERMDPRSTIEIDPNLSNFETRNNKPRLNRGYTDVYVEERSDNNGGNQ